MYVQEAVLDTWSIYSSRQAPLHGSDNQLLRHPFGLGVAISQSTGILDHVRILRTLPQAMWEHCICAETSPVGL